MNKFSKTTMCVLCASLLALTVHVPMVSAQSDDLGPILDRLQRLERDIRTLNLSVSRSGTGAPASAADSAVANEPVDGPAAARLAVKIADLEDELRMTTGKIETMTYEIDQIGQRLDKLISDIDYRLSAIETNTGPEAGAPKIRAAPSPPGVQKVAPGAPPGTLGSLKASDLASPQPDGGTASGSAATAAVSSQPLQQTAATTSVLPSGTVQQHYKFAFDLLRKADYEQAEAAFKEFLSLHGEDKLAGNARYWLGESHYVRAQFVEAAETFLAAYQADQKGAKAPDSLLKLGMSLANLDKKAQACASFGKLQKEFPKLSVSIRTKLVAEKKKNGCK